MTTAWHIKALCLAGRIILENGGETYRAEDTVTHLAVALGLSEVDAFGLPSGLFISFTDEEGERRSSVIRVRLQGTNLQRLDRVNQISRELTAGTLLPGDLMDALQKAQKLGDTQSLWRAPLLAGCSALGFAAMFGGRWIDWLIAAVCAGLSQMIPRIAFANHRSMLIDTLLGTLTCTVIPLFLGTLYQNANTDAMVAAALMPLLPGISMTTALQDILRGDMVSGVAHGARALMIAVIIAGGAIVGTQFFDLLMGGV